MGSRHEIKEMECTRCGDVVNMAGDYAELSMVTRDGKPYTERPVCVVCAVKIIAAPARRQPRVAE